MKIKITTYKNNSKGISQIEDVKVFDNKPLEARKEAKDYIDSIKAEPIPYKLQNDTLYYDYSWAD